MRRYISVVLLSIVCFVGTAPCFGLTQQLHKLGEKILYQYIGRSLFREFLFQELYRNFDRKAEALSLFLEETSKLLGDLSLIETEWLQQLQEDEFIFTYTLGEQRSPEFKKGSGYYIDGIGTLHYIFIDESSSVFLDTVINTSRIERILTTDIKGLRVALLYDRSRETMALLHGAKTAMTVKWMDLIVHLEKKSFLIVKEGIVIAKSITIDDSDLMFISLYSIQLGRRSYHIFGLIALMIITIFLMVGMIKHAVRSLVPSSKGVPIMADDKSKRDVISEIDKEISDIIDEELSTPKFTPSEKGKPKTKEQVKKVEATEEEKQKRLEDDGIIIKRG